MRTHADHAFHIGTQHLRGGLPCQDYALSGTTSLRAFAVISDGCSTGGRTDIGARILSLATAEALQQDGHFHEDMVDQFVDDRLRDAERCLSLTAEDLLATSGYAACDGRFVETRIIGDGVIAAKHGSFLAVTRLEWAKNMPAYPIYRRDDFGQFVTAHGGPNVDAAQVTYHTTGQTYPRAFAPSSDYLRGISHSFSVENWDAVAVFSDGVTQVDGMDWRDVVTELMAFKSTEGDFVKRRMNRFLKDCLKHGRGPIDDISMAAIIIDHEAADVA